MLHHKVEAGTCTDEIHDPIDHRPLRCHSKINGPRNTAKFLLQPPGLDTKPNGNRHRARSTSL